MNENKPINILELIISFFAPLSSVILMIFGGAFYTTFVSLFLDSEGYSRQEIGYIQSAYFLGMLVGAFQMEKLIKRVGHIQALTVFGSLATCSTLLQALSQTFPLWILLRFLVGLSLAALYIVIESWMLHHSKPKTRGVILSLYMICLYSAQAASQQVLAFIDIHSFTPYLISALFTSLSVIPVGLSTNRITLPPPHESISLFKIIKVSPFGVLGCFIAGLILSAVYSFFPLFSTSKQIPSENLMSITIAGGALLQLPIGKLSDYFERRKTMLATVITSLLFTFVFYLNTDASTTVILTLLFLIGGLLFTLYPLSITQVCDHVDHFQVTTATALLLVAYGFGSVLGPILSSEIVNAFGINAIFLYFSLLLGILGFVGIYTSLQRPIIPLDEQTDFQAMPTFTPIASEMDPRSEDSN